MTKPPKPTVAQYAAFRDELVKLMPGYTWTVHKSHWPDLLQATGTQSSGSNRLSTLAVERREHDGKVSYEAKSAGYGLRARWLHTNTDGTLARALRGLQDHYEGVAQAHSTHAHDLQKGRPPRPDKRKHAWEQRDELIETLEKVLKHFTKTPSTLADTTVRGDAHAVIKRIREAS